MIALKLLIFHNTNLTALAAVLLDAIHQELDSSIRHEELRAAIQFQTWQVTRLFQCWV